MTTLVDRAPTARRAGRGRLVLEWAVLLLAAPFLLFPEVWPLAAAAALLALAVVWLNALAVGRPLPPTPFNLVLVLWGIVLIIGMLASADPTETLPKATGLVLGLALWRFLVTAVTTRRHLSLATAGLLIVALGFTVVGLLGLQELPKIPALAALNPVQAAALPVAIHPNQLAGLICLYLPLLVSLIFSERGRFASLLWSVVFAALALLAGAILVLSQSRGGWLAAMAGLFTLLALWSAALPPSRTRRALRVLTMLAAAAALGAALWVGPANLRDLWLNPPQETVVGTLTTLNFRKELWPWAVTAVGDFPFTGVGLGAFRQVAFRLYPLPAAGGLDIGHAHNIFLQTALDTGLPGLVVYVALLMVAAAAAWRAARRPRYRALSLGLLAGLVALHVFGLADALALGSKPGLVFWYALGLLAVMNKEELVDET